MQRRAMRPAPRIPGHQTQKNRLRWNPVRKLAHADELPQCHATLLQFEVAQIFQDNVGHRHTQSHGKILLRHGLLFRRIREKSNQALRQIVGVTGLIELNRHALPVGHLAEIFKVCADNRHAVSACQVRHSATSGRRGIRHHRDRRALEKIRQALFVHVAGKFNARIAGTFFLHRFHIARRLRMISSTNHQSGVGQGFRNVIESFDHQLQPFISSPLAKSQDAMLWISPAREIRILGFARKNAVGAKVDIIPPVFFMQDFSITGHKHGNGIGQKQQAGGETPR